MARTIALLCSLGDVTISWQAQNDAVVLPCIQRMLDRKVRFHIVRKGKASEVTKLSQASDARKIVLPDESLGELIASGVLLAGALIMGETTGEIAKTAQAVADNDTVATQPPEGG